MTTFVCTGRQSHKRWEFHLEESRDKQTLFPVYDEESGAQIGETTLDRLPAQGFTNPDIGRADWTRTRARMECGKCSRTYEFTASQLEELGARALTHGVSTVDLSYP